MRTDYRECKGTLLVNDEPVPEARRIRRLKRSLLSGLAKELRRALATDQAALTPA